MAYYLGIDGGATKTTCVVGDENSVLATASGGPSNITRIGESGVRETLHAVIREACAAARIAPQDVSRSCLGVAGAGRQEVASLVRKIADEIISGEIEVTGDMLIALEAAFGDGPGVIVIAGTGSFAYGRNADGETARAGGWGFAISDEGSAHWIGRMAVSETLRSVDAGGDSSALLENLMRVRQVGSFDEFVRSVNSAHDFAAFFPAITEMAQSGESIALKVLREAGEQLAQLAGMVLGRLFAEDGSLSVPLAMAGGVFRYAAVVRESFYNEVRKLWPGAILKSEMAEPVYGALRRARRRG